MYVISFDMGICNLAYCILNVKTDKSYDIIEWKRVKLEGDKKNIEDLSLSLLELLDHITYTSIGDPSCDLVWLIENQPAFKAPTMKSLQMVIHTYAMILKKNVNPNIIIKFMSASSKLKYIEKKSSIKVDKKNYKSHKDTSIQYTQELLKSLHSTIKIEIIECFNKEKKKDDMSDCLLQALYFIDAF